MIEELKKNVNTEIEMLKEISARLQELDYAGENEAKLLNGAIWALGKSMKIINDSIPDILRNISFNKRLPSAAIDLKKETGLEKIKFKREKSEVSVILNVKDKEKFFKELSINENLVRKLKKKTHEQKEKYEEFKAARGYLKAANRFFLDTSIKWINKGMTL